MIESPTTIIVMICILQKLKLIPFKPYHVSVSLKGGPNFKGAIYDIVFLHQGLLVNGMSKGRPACAGQTFMPCFPYVCDENNKDQYTLIERSNTLVKQVDCALPSASYMCTNF